MNPTPPKPVPPTFEQVLEQLEEIVRVLEAGDTSLEESLTRYEQGVTLLKCGYEQLRLAEQKILLLSGEDADGKPISKPFEHPNDSERLNSRSRPPKKSEY
ncbi:MAG TPA: exodeoxyribonuclease VII small subunit [Gemmataceae bacterium]|jgi:exodeoxyribonuclease VII small subunit|nr:exodeoxyribonuclease VII small subunit [Gemmataceae bacterium]